MFEISSADLDEARDALPGLESYGHISTPPSYSVNFADVEPGGYRGHKRELIMSWPLEDAGPGRAGWLLCSAMSWFGVYVMATVPSRAETGILVVLMAISGIPALTFTYLLLVSLLNRTHLTITRDLLQVRHGPLPWPGNRVIPTAEIQDIHCSRSVSGRHKGFVSYALNARLRSGGTHPVVVRLKYPRTAMLIKQCVQDTLII
ncbi:PH domain-containing protein [Sorangium cellulosum]|uniref:PH domain-containing protein n=1 Tax=Sorangium cellulosum TaxID=56 RepID=UPI001F409B8B|nr:PH domain-containing protein [Sorangium cellulosum]